MKSIALDSKYKPALLALIIFLASVLTSCSPRILPARTELVMGTVCTVNAYEQGSKALYDEIFSDLAFMEELFSTTREDSVINRVNAMAGKDAVEVPEDFALLLEQSLFYARLSRGAFDPSIGPLVKLWNINGENPTVPQNDQIVLAVSKIDYTKVLLWQQENSFFVKLSEEGMSLELGGIAKGYAADRICAVLQNHQVKRAVIDLGGNIYCWGTKPDSQPWKIGIKNPMEPSSLACVAEFKENLSVVTSGSYERYFVQDGKTYHHILDSASGWPVETQTKGVTIFSSSSLMADALSTIAFILGPEAFYSFLEENSINDVCAAFINEKRDVLVVGPINCTSPESSVVLNAGDWGFDLKYYIPR